jgi:DNA mismatch repair protein MutL
VNDPADVRAPRIIRLPETVAAKIAAGEVVERPAAAVKELVENALDAGAGRIDVAIEQGGRRLLEVADDGCGMTPAEARLALERHATSKIRTVDDLLAIETYGFRGEALGSIAAVSRFALVTRVRDAVAGFRIEVDGGTAVAERPAGTPAGTTVTARDLFFNLPARRQFLRSAATETAQVVDVVTRLALARPDVAISLTVDGRLAVAGRRDADLAERLDALLGPGAPPLVEVRAEEEGLAVTGRVSPPGVSRAGASSLYLFVNGRPVRDRSLLHATLKGSRHAHEPGRYPMGALFVVVPPHMVDVNVHPQKAEVRFRDPAAVHGLVARAVEAALVAAGAFPAVAVRSEVEAPTEVHREGVQAALDLFLARAERVGEGGESSWGRVCSSALPNAPSPLPARSEIGAPHSSGRWIAAAAALLVALGATVLLVTRETEKPSVAAVAAPTPGAPGMPPALPAAPPPAPARLEVAEPPGSSRLVLTLEEQPTPGATDAAPQETVEVVVDYTVVQGDTLWAIARRHTESPFRYREIASDNDLRNPDLIFPGQALTLKIRRLR